MLLSLSWKNRGMDADGLRRLMDVWGKLEAQQAEMPGFERVCWYLNADGTGGYSVLDVSDADSTIAFALEAAIAFGEQLEIDCRPVVAMEAAVAAIGRGLEHLS